MKTINNILIMFKSVRVFNIQQTEPCCINLPEAEKSGQDSFLKAILSEIIKLRGC